MLLDVLLLDVLLLDAADALLSLSNLSAAVCS